MGGKITGSTADGAADRVEGQQVMGNIFQQSHAISQGVEIDGLVKTESAISTIIREYDKSK